MLACVLPENQNWAFILAQDERGWIVKCVESGPQLTRGGMPIENLDEALEQIRLLAELISTDELTIKLSQFNREQSGD